MQRRGTCSDRTRVRTRAWLPRRVSFGTALYTNGLLVGETIPVMLTVPLLLPLIDDGGGRIVNISSGLTRFAMPGSASYASMKGAIEVLTRYLAKELGQRQIADITTLGRTGVPDDIGPMVAALLSEDNRWINAQRIEVSGGMAL